MIEGRKITKATILFLHWKKKQKRKYLFLDILPGVACSDCCVCDLTARGALDLETYRSQARRTQQRLGFCRNGGLLPGIQMKQPGNRTEKTKKRWALWLFRLASPSTKSCRLDEQTDRSGHHLHCTREHKQRERGKTTREATRARREGGSSTGPNF